jgi:hypothetical protein
MANLSSDQDSGATEPIDYEQPDPQVHVSAAHSDPARLSSQLSAHLREHVEHIQRTADYGGHGTGYNSQGGFTGSGMQGGASGSADYSTTNQGTTGDADSAGT